MTQKLKIHQPWTGSVMGKVPKMSKAKALNGARRLVCSEGSCPISWFAVWVSLLWQAKHLANTCFAVMVAPGTHTIHWDLAVTSCGLHQWAGFLWPAGPPTIPPNSPDTHTMLPWDLAPRPWKCPLRASLAEAVAREAVPGHCSRGSHKKASPFCHTNHAAYHKVLETHMAQDAQNQKGFNTSMLCLTVSSFDINLSNLLLIWHISDTWLVKNCQLLKLPPWNHHSMEWCYLTLPH